MLYKPNRLNERFENRKCQATLVTRNRRCNSTWLRVYFLGMADLNVVANDLTNVIVRALQANAPAVCEDYIGALCVDCGVCAAVCADRTRQIIGAGAERVSAR